jgi:uncharacterized protein
VQGLAGFGFSLVSVSFWAWGLAPQSAAVLSTVGGLLGQVLAAATVRRGARWRLLWPMLAGGLAGVPVGLLLLGHVDVRGFRLFVGGLLAVWCPLMLLSNRLPHLRFGGRWADAAAGACGGLMGPLGGFTGVIPTLWCTLRGMDRDEQRSVIQNFNLALLAVTTVAYGYKGVLGAAHLPAIGVVAVALLLPSLLGMRIYIGLSPATFRNIVLGLLTASGVAMLLSVL